MIRAWLVVIALAGCSKGDEDKAKAAAATAKEKASQAVDRAKEAASVAKDKVGEAVHAGDAAFDRLVRKPGILEETDEAVRRAAEAVRTATSEAARKAALTTLETVTKARAAIAKRIDELKAAGTF